MFTPQSKFRVSGVVEGVAVDVRITTSAVLADASGRIPSTKPGVTDVHNAATMLLVAVNTVLSRMQEQEAGIPAAEPPQQQVAAQQGPRPVIDMRAFLNNREEGLNDSEAPVA